ncbi:tRNA-splicing endonuclease subunit Sen15 [Tricharina praecox]|uniref:tRNA-splicing endonuclease subunit Sen15 n=1 Tax=Tricharina praecox TaxID=43433 RepID=UPI00222065B3|nr:tRNA-splicing endonuclease subunit Sen15 [Tricharina praecox]KAI5853899.1 tRNA-splicing endonuclease subunit Sen15 [Tricharina praecox]
MSTASYTPAAQAAHTHLVTIVHRHLESSALWTSLSTHPASSTLPRPLLTGVPPSPQQVEWVLPVDLREKWSPRKMAEVFDAMPAGVWGSDAKGATRKKRLLLAVVAEDSAVAYYFVHDGVVKPRQN